MSRSPARIVFAGTPDFAAVILAGIIDAGYRIDAVYSQPDRPAGRGRRLRAGPVKELAQQHGLAVMQPASLRGDEARQALQELAPDILVVVAYGLILPAEILAIPRLGCVNVHASLLPRWRGAAPIQHALLAGDHESGISLMQMDEGLDTGPVLARKALPIAPDETAASLHDRLALLGRDLLLDTLPGLAAGHWSSEPQSDADACYAAKISKQDAAIDWQSSATDIDRRIRAYHPWPVAFTFRPGDGQRLRIWRARLLPELRGAPGEVVAVQPAGIDVAATDGGLRLTEVQAAGGKRLSVADYLNAHPVEVGEKFGDMPDE